MTRAFMVCGRQTTGSGHLWHVGIRKQSQGTQRYGRQATGSGHPWGVEGR